MGELMDDGTDGLTRKIIGAAITVHRALGPGLFENPYERCVGAELRHIGLSVRRQVPVSLSYRDLHLENAYRMDMVVEDAVVVEVKAADQLAPIHVTQVLTYLRLSGLRVGLIFNFNAEVLADGGIRRVLL